MASDHDIRAKLTSLEIKHSNNPIIFNDNISAKIIDNEQLTNTNELLDPTQ